MQFIILHFSFPCLRFYRSNEERKRFSEQHKIYFVASHGDRSRPSIIHSLSERKAIDLVRSPRLDAQYFDIRDDFFDCQQDETSSAPQINPLPSPAE